MSLTLRNLVAEHFKANPNKWISMQELASLAGTGGWRTRVSECRVQLGMNLVNRTARIKTASGQKITKSEYQYRPADLLELAS